jgi:hypothetical protein
MTTTTPCVDVRAAALASLDRLLDMTAELGLAVAADPGRLPPPALAGVLEAAEGCCRLLEACRAALPAEGGQEGRRGRRGLTLSDPGVGKSIQPTFAGWTGPGAPEPRRESSPFEAEAGFVAGLGAKPPRAPPPASARRVGRGGDRCSPPGPPVCKAGGPLAQGTSCTYDPRRRRWAETPGSPDGTGWAAAAAWHLEEGLRLLRQ